MKKFFNTAGPIIPEDHYFIPSKERMDWDELNELIENKRYFILHAPRQTGKTTAMLELMHELNEDDKYTALYINIEGAQTARSNVNSGISTVCSVLAGAAKVYLQETRLWDWYYQNDKIINENDRLKNMIAHWSQINEKPIVLFIDEIDALIGDTLVSVLRQLRAGYNQRPKAFPQSVILCGVRDIKDYRIHLSSGDIITGGSAFNIKAESLTIGNFTYDEIKNLFLQHTQETGQRFDDRIWDELWEDTEGQPWLVNALGYEMTYKDKEARDPKVDITLEKYFAAREGLIQSRATHLDQLTDKLKEPRVHNVIEAILSGKDLHENFPMDDITYLEDLGLIKARPQIQISNRIYREVIPREITWPIQVMLSHPTAWYVTQDNHLDMNKLLGAFQQFFRENSEAWFKSMDFLEAGPLLLMMAFLQRVVNGGGRINREYAVGSKRMDLFIEWPVDGNDATKGFSGEVQRVVIELKILRGSLDALLAKGLEQTSEYADKVKADEAHLVIFNRNPEIPWEEKIWQRNEKFHDRTIFVWGS